MITNVTAFPMLAVSTILQNLFFRGTKNCRMLKLNQLILRSAL